MAIYPAQEEQAISSSCRESEKNEALKREARVFFLGFPRKYAPLRTGSYELVGCNVVIALQPSIHLYLCVIRYLFRTLYPRLSMNTAPTPVDGFCATHSIEPLSCLFHCTTLRVCRGRCGDACFHRHGWPMTFPTSERPYVSQRVFVFWKTKLYRARNITNSRPNVSVHITILAVSLIACCKLILPGSPFWWRDEKALL